MFKNNKKSNKGFTLIEILIVIGIIAMLATIVIVAINPARQFAQARDTQRVSNVNAILNAIGQYIADNKGTIPAGIPSAAADIKDDGVDICDLLVTTYMSAFPVDPSITAGAASDGQITKAECDDYDAGYFVVKDADGRITVSAPSTEIGADISITR